MFSAQILLASKKRNEIYYTCREVLSQFHENIPESFDRKRMAAIMSQTQTLVAKVSDEEWLSMKDMTDSSFRAIIKFYSVMLNCCFFLKQELMVSSGDMEHEMTLFFTLILSLNSQQSLLRCFSKPFLCCRLIHITLEHGLCSDTILGLVQYGTVLAMQSNSFFQGAYRIGKVALKLVKRYNASHLLPSVYCNFYGRVASQKDPIQQCIDMSRVGYKRE